MKRFAALLLVALAGAAPGAHKVVRNSPALEFDYQWPREAAAIPALDSRLYAEAKADLAQAQGFARDDQQATRDQNRDFHRHFYTMTWTVAGQSPRLLSLAAQNSTFTGGAHPNHVFTALLWDRRGNRPISVESLFVRQSALAALTRKAYCAKLDAERMKRRGEKIGGQFDDCPTYSDLAISPVDRDRDGHFDGVAFTASPYTAGPYSEGEYEISLPVTRRLIAAMKPAYRSSFEAQRQ